MKFDAHAHINTSDIAAYPVSPVDGHLPETALSHAFPVDALIAAMDESGIAKALVVQRSHVYGYDNRYILAMSAAHSQRIRPLCMVDGRRPDAATQAAAVMDQGSVGIRYMEPEKGGGLDWLGGDFAHDAWAAAVGKGGSIRVHFFGWNRAEGLAIIAKRLQAMPETVLVLDHLSNLDPTMGDHGVDALLRSVADHAGTYLLFSMINLMKWSAAGIDPAPVIERVVALFGADRVLWGSDVGNTLGGYGDMITRSEAACAGLSEADREWVFQKTAAKVYAL